MTRCFSACDSLVEMITRTLLCLFLLGGCGEVIKQQCPVAEQCNGVCCGPNESCVAGACSACGPNELSCGTTCVNPATDQMNCGECGMTCGGMSTCSNGQCTTVCSGSQVACGNTCVDTQNDANNCGMCGKTCGTGGACVAGACATGYYALTGTPSPSTVFNTIEQTYKFPNNLAASIWQRESNMILTGEFSQPGYWAFPAGSTSYVATPDRDVAQGQYGRLVLVPATDTVVYTKQSSSNTTGPALPGQIMVATISRTTGLLGTPQTAVFSDNHAAGCQLHSASATQFLCLTNDTIRRYTTARGSATLTYADTITLSTALPAATPCGTCFGGVFAFDGAYYYFTSQAFNTPQLSYVVYTANGTYSATYTVTGTGALNSVYFDWSVGRYSSHDGYGGRSGGTVYTTVNPTGDSDTHTFSAVSTAHTLR